MSSQQAKAPYYFVPGLSKWPVLGSLSLLVMMSGASGYVNEVPGAGYLNLLGLFMFLAVVWFWFRDAITESETGLYSKRIDISYRWSMGWFIFSETMFFAAFFGALYYARSVTMPWLADLDHKLLWPDFAGNWGAASPSGLVEQFNTIGPWPLPTINTALLLTSGITLTIAHHALRESNRKKTIIWLAATVALGAIFMVCQAAEYVHAYSAEVNLKMTSGVYGSTFFMLTGFHGFHVILGTIMLAVVLGRTIKGHFTAESHFAFEGAAWYWHFVDVVWLLLYVVVYWM